MSWIDFIRIVLLLFWEKFVHAKRFSSVKSAEVFALENIGQLVQCTTETSFPRGWIILVDTFDILSTMLSPGLKIGNLELFPTKSHFELRTKSSLTRNTFKFVFHIKFEL